MRFWHTYTARLLYVCLLLHTFHNTISNSMIVLLSLGFFIERGRAKRRSPTMNSNNSTLHMTYVQAMTLTALETHNTFVTECKWAASTAFVNHLEILFRSSHNALRIGSTSVVIFASLLPCTKHFLWRMESISLHMHPHKKNMEQWSNYQLLKFLDRVLVLKTTHYLCLKC